MMRPGGMEFTVMPYGPTSRDRPLAGTVKLGGLSLGGGSEVGYPRPMTTHRDPLYSGYRYPAELISYAVWLYFRFPLSLRMVEEMLAARGISVTYETIRQWGLKFGREFANRIRQRAPRLGDKWHLDEVVITIAGKKHWLWRAVDQQGFVLDVLVQSRRDKKAAKRLFRKLLKKQGRAPRVLITDKLRSYGAAKPSPLTRTDPLLLMESDPASAHRFVVSGSRHLILGLP
jgi:transposase-like protein